MPARCLQDPAEYFTIEDCVVKDSLTKVDDANKCLPHRRKDGEASTVLSFVQRYEDPGAMPTRWQAQLEPPGMVGWWFTDADDDGEQDEDENGGTFTATRESTPGQALPQATTAAADEVKAAKAEAEAAASAAKVYLGEAEEASAALAVAEASVETLKKQLSLTEAKFADAVRTVCCMLLSTELHGLVHSSLTVIQIRIETECGVCRRNRSREMR